jgi:signal transduction histidine kinase
MSVDKNSTKQRVEILIVEDSPTQAEQLRYLLEQHSYHVTVASNGKLALDRLAEYTPAMVISDIVMPEMSGFELCTRIKAEERTRGIPVILLTSLSNKEEVLEGLACGADLFITKPYIEKNLLAQVQQIIADGTFVYRERIPINLSIQTAGKSHEITVYPHQMLSLLLSTYDAAVARNHELLQTQNELQSLNVELESAKTAAEKANLAKSDFLSSMSHELRSPLNAILGFAQLMESDSPPPSLTQQESVNQILQAGWHLLKLINEILDLAKIESGKLSLSPESLPVAEIMHQCQAMIEAQAQKRGISMTFPIFDIPYFVHADRTRVKQVLMNLLSNAIKYNNARGMVVVECFASAPERIRISVKDTGEGLPPEKLTQLFQPFNRLGQEIGVEEGTGIGLVVAKQLVELMGGVIGAESTVGVGSVFWIELIADVAPPSAVKEEETTAGVQPPVQHGARVRILLYIEDNLANLKLVEQLIARRPDLRLLTAVNGLLGLELARTAQPEMILMDINLPDISGIEALKILRADPATAHIPVVAVSANAMARDIESGLAAGFFSYITKPIIVKEFMEVVNVALEFAEKVSVAYEDHTT